MMKTRLFLTVAMAIAASGSLRAQPPAPPAPTPEAPDAQKPANTPKGIWQASLPGGTYMISVDKITSVSRHKYLLDGSLVVDEVTVDSTGQALARFYFISPLGSKSSVPLGETVIDKGKGLFEDASEKVGVADPSTMVVKKYPETTHARTIEYRLTSEEQLTSLFNSARDGWTSGRGGQFRAK